MLDPKELKAFGRAIAGTSALPGPLVGTSSMTVDDAPPLARVAGTSFEVEIEPAGHARASGRGGASRDVEDERVRVTVEVTPKTMLSVPQRCVRGAWRDIETDLAVAPFRAHAPGPDSNVTVEATCVFPGDRVAVVGEVTAESEPIGGYRGGKRAPRVIEASLLASGEDAPARLDALVAARDAQRTSAARRAKDERGLPRWKKTVPFVVLAPMLAAAFFVHRFDARHALVCAVTGIAASLAAAIEVRGSGVPAFAPFHVGTFKEDATKKVRAPSEGRFAMLQSFFVVFGAVVIWFPIQDLLTMLIQSQRVSTGQVWVPCLPVVFGLGAATHALGHARAARLARALLDAPPLPIGAPKGTWGSAEGTVHDDTPVVSGAALEQRTRLRKEPGSDPAIRLDQLNEQGGFTIASVGGEITVHPEGAVWGTTDVSTTVSTTKFFGGTTRTNIVARVSIGGAILAAGRASGDDKLELRASGVDSLIFFATRGESPRSVLEAALRRRRVVVLVYGALALAFAVLAAVVWSGLPPLE